MSTFAKLLRNSKFISIGRFEGQVLVGKIEHRVNDDLYIDFGCKFPAVCQRPEKDAERYVIGQKVLIKLHDPELSERFLGSKRDLTLLEADATLIGIFKTKEERDKERRQQESQEFGIEDRSENQEMGSTTADEKQQNPSNIS